MNSKNYDALIGTKNNRLTLVGYHKLGRRVFADCVCDCGNKCTPLMFNFISGHSKSCGCYSKEVQSTRFYKHGLSDSKLYKTYHSMLNRCYLEKSTNYKKYGGRGITVCDEWKECFETFYKWAMDNGYSDDLTIERIDVNGNYEPSNCKWITQKEQGYNKRNTHYLNYKGKTYCLSQLGEKAVCGKQAFRGRIQSGWDVEKALTTPINENYSNKKIRKKI